MVDKGKVDKLIKLKGDTRGATFQTDASCIRKIKGDEGLKLISSRMDELGYHIDYNNIKTLELYPLGLRALTFEVMVEEFSWSGKEIKFMGSLAPDVSFMVKLLLRYFISTEKMFKNASKLWSDHYSLGNLISKEINKKEQEIIVALEDIEITDLYCSYLEGYFQKLVSYTEPMGDVIAETTKYLHKGDDCYEFRIFYGK